MENWTSEELALMTEKLAERKKREAEAIRGRTSSSQRVSDTELFSEMGKQVKVVRKGVDNSKARLYPPEKRSVQ